MKYRIWCKNKSEYEKDQCFLTPDGRLFQEMAHGRMQPLSLENHIIERSTGLPDKNGKLIFEGDYFTDINMSENGLVGFIGWNDGACCFQVCTVPITDYQNGKPVIDFSEVLEIFDIEEWDFETEVEVIGNIHDKE